MFDLVVGVNCMATSGTAERPENQRSGLDVVPEGQGRGRTFTSRQPASTSEGRPAHGEKKQRVLERLGELFERYFGLG